ncbi:MAG: hypothetical protein ABJB98_10210 [Actinomycetota bacterium]
MSSLPTPLRAALGVVATAVETARTLPQKAVELPVIAVSSALQLSLRAQQRYAALTVRGDELIGRFHGVPDEAPPWATFDETPLAASELPQGTVEAAADAKATTRARRAARSAAEKPPRSPAARRTTPAKRARAANDQSVPMPRNGKPSAFDDVSQAANGARRRRARSAKTSPEA